MKAVADLDEDHPDVLGHGHEHLAQVLHLLLFLGDILHPGQLGNALHQRGHRRAELFGDLVVGGVGVLDAVVEQGRDDAVHIQPQVGHNVGHGQRVDDIGLAALAQLAVVLGVGIGKGGKQPLSIQIRSICADFIFQRLIAFQNGVHRITSTIESNRGRPRLTPAEPPAGGAGSPKPPGPLYAPAGAG